MRRHANKQNRGVQVWVGSSVAVVPHDKDVATEPSEGRKPLGGMRFRHDEYAYPGIAIRTRGVEFLERLLCGVQRISL